MPKYAALLVVLGYSAPGDDFVLVPHGLELDFERVDEPAAAVVLVSKHVAVPEEVEHLRTDDVVGAFLPVRGCHARCLRPPSACNTVTQCPVSARRAISPGETSPPSSPLHRLLAVLCPRNPSLRASGTSRRKGLPAVAPRKSGA